MNPLVDHHSSLIYGLSGSGKSSFIESLIRELLQTCPPGSKARIVTAEHYGAYAPAVKDGLAEVWRFNNRPHPFETSRAAIQGFWPANPADPSSKLVAPTLETFAKYPIRVFEGLGTTASYISSNHIEGGLLQKAGKGEVMGPVQEHVQFMDGDEGVGGLCWTHYRIGQMEMRGLVQSSQKYPGYVIWTSHEDTGKDQGQPFIGPEVIGSKLTGIIGAEFDELLHLVGVSVDVQDSTGELRRLVERRLYLKEHIYPGGQIACKAKNSASLAKQKTIPDYIRLSKDGTAVEDAAKKFLAYFS